MQSFSTMMDSVGYFEPSPTVAVATSGGPDSMALLLLAHRWASERGGKVVALTVDHGLRPESALEAVQVGNWCAAQGIEHHILRWVGEKPRTGLQEAARHARYGLLTDWCRTHHILHLLTAHHRDDQAETLCFRLARGSGLSGLAGMQPESLYQGVRLLRPLLECSKSELIQCAEQAGQDYITDPSNSNPAYSRTHLRQLLVDDCISQRISYVAQSLGNFRNHLENNILSCLTESLFIYPEGYAVIHHSAFLKLPEEYALKMLAAVTKTISGTQDPLRTEKLERLYQQMQHPTRRNVAGCLFEYKAKRGAWMVTREPHAAESAIALSAEVPAFWDNRFQVDFAGINTGTTMIYVKALGADGIKQLGKKRPRHVETSILQVLPSFWVLEELLCVPHIHYQHPDYMHLACTARFRPAKPLAAAPFSGKTSRNNYQECA